MFSKRTFIVFLSAVGYSGLFIVSAAPAPTKYSAASVANSSHTVSYPYACSLVDIEAHGCTKLAAAHPLATGETGNAAHVAVSNHFYFHEHKELVDLHSFLTAPRRNRSPQTGLLPRAGNAQQNTTTPPAMRNDQQNPQRPVRVPARVPAIRKPRFFGWGPQWNTQHQSICKLAPWVSRYPRAPDSSPMVQSSFYAFNLV